MSEENGNGKSGVSLGHAAQVASTGVLLLAMFGLWWNSADPRARLDKADNSILEARHELNESITAIRKDMSDKYLTFREYSGYESHIKADIDRVEASLKEIERLQLQKCNQPPSSPLK